MAQRTHTCSHQGSTPCPVCHATPAPTGYGSSVTIGFTAPPTVPPEPAEVTRIVEKARKQVDAALAIHATDTAPHVQHDYLSLGARIEHTALSPTAQHGDITQLCQEAAAHRFAAVCVNPIWVATASQLLNDTDVAVATVVGFPLGANRPVIKAAEARAAVQDGATEVDMVADIAAIAANDLPRLYRDIRTVVEAVAPVPVKVILEIGHLTAPQIATASIVAQRAGAAYVKTSTGFGPGGATVDGIAIMRAAVGPHMGIKASGGIRDRETAERLVAAGADRIGTSASLAIAATPID